MCLHELVREANVPVKAEKQPAAKTAELDRLTVMLRDALRTSGYMKPTAAGPTQEAPGKLNGGVYTATLYPGPKGNFVFNAATCWWADGLSEPPGYVRPSAYTSPKGPDARAQRITANILNRMLKS